MPQAASDKRDLLLEPLVQNIPDAVTAVVVTIDGLPYSLYQQKVIDIEEDRLSPMTAAGWSLSDRILSELRQGDFRHTIITGTKGTIVFVALGDQHVLTLCVKKIASYNGLLAQLEPLLKPICDYMGVSEVRFFV